MTFSCAFQSSPVLNGGNTRPEEPGASVVRQPGLTESTRRINLISRVMVNAYPGCVVACSDGAAKGTTR